MIRSVGKTSSCSPGGNCCGSCKGHQHLGDTTCDASGNCYEVTSSITYGDPVSGPAALPLLSPIATAAQNAATGVINPGGISPATLYIGGAFLLVLLLELTSRKR